MVIRYTLCAWRMPNMYMVCGNVSLHDLETYLKKLYKEEYTKSTTDETWTPTRSRLLREIAQHYNLKLDLL